MSACSDFSLTVVMKEAISILLWLTTSSVIPFGKINNLLSHFGL